MPREKVLTLFCVGNSNSLISEKNSSLFQVRYIFANTLSTDVSVNLLGTLKSSKTTPMCSLYVLSSSSTSSSKKLILPLSLCLFPTIVLMSVDLPEPFLPIKPTTSQA